MVSPELETANAISATLGLPAARQTDIFADGEVQIVEFDVPGDAPRNNLIGRNLRDAEMPANSKVAAIIRGERMIVPRGDQQILPGDRVVVIASPDSARAWARMCGRKEERVDDVVIFGAGQMGTTIATVLLERGHPPAGRRRRPRPRALDRRAPAGGRAPSTRTRSTRSSSTTSGSAARPRPCSASTTTPATSTARSSPSATACG